MNDIPSTRTRIITEATRLFASKGIKATTVAEIEQCVGLRKGSGGVHRHFATKSALVSAVLEAQFEVGKETLESAKVALPLPSSDDVGPYLLALGRLVLSEAEKNREVALIMLRDAQTLGDQGSKHQDRNDDLAYGSTARAVREIQERTGRSIGLNPEAFGYVFLSPLIYFKLIEWATGRHPLQITDEALIESWAKVMEPMFRKIVESNATQAF